MNADAQIQRWLDRATDLVFEAGDMSALYPDETRAPPLTLKGKMIRARLLLLCAQCLDVLGEPAAYLGAGIEMIHNASLFHDDVVDEATLRRGGTALHRTSGNRVAIMTGDICFAKAMELICRVNHLQVYREISHSVVALSSGQLAEWVHQGSDSFSLDRYYSIIDRKTGSLISLCLVVPGILAGLPPEKIERMRSAGHMVGRAFQVVDDLLDLGADSDSTGKDAFADLADGKYTFPYLLILQDNNEEASALIRQAYKNPDFDREQLRRVLAENGLRAKALQILNACMDQTKKDLATVLDPDGTHRLFDFLENLASRSY